MNGSTIIFYLLSLLTLGSAIIAVTTRQIFRSAIALLFSLIGIAGIYFWLDYNFIAAVQIVVYVGGIVVLIIFSILLTQQAGALLPVNTLSQRLFAGLAAFCMLAICILVIGNYTFNSIENAPSPSITQIGTQMLSTEQDGYALPFELVSILLLASLVGCIIIALKFKEEN